MASSVTTNFVYLTIIVGRTGTSIAHNNKREDDEHKHQTLKCTNCSHYAFDSLHSVKLFRQNFWIIQHSSHGFSDSQVTNSPTLLYDVCGVKAPANKTLHPSPQGYPVFSNVMSCRQSYCWPNGSEALWTRMVNFLFDQGTWTVNAAHVFLYWHSAITHPELSHDNNYATERTTWLILTNGATETFVKESSVYFGCI